MNMSRRTFLSTTAALAGAAMAPRLFAADADKRIRVSSCTIGMDGAKKAGLDGIEVNVGGAADTLNIARQQTRDDLKAQMRSTGLAISSFMMGLLNSYPLATDPRGPAWLEQSIDAARDLGAQVILVAFFGKGSLGNAKNPKKPEIDAVVERVKAAAPRAKDAGVILGLENTLSAQQNAEILDRIANPAVKIYYDVGNLTGQGYDVPAEVRFLKDRIAIFHFKDGRDYLGEGRIKFEPIRDAMLEINYKGWIVLEASHPSGNAVADNKRNAEFIRKLFMVA